MASIDPNIQAHRDWLGQIQPFGLVVSPPALVRAGVHPDKQEGITKQASLYELMDDAGELLTSLRRLLVEVLGWREADLAGSFGGPDLPAELSVTLPEFRDLLTPTYAVPDPENPGGWLMLISTAESGEDLDEPPKAGKSDRRWHASPQARFERMLRGLEIPVGLLFNGTSLRLVYAPRGESSGHLTFTFKYLLETAGRPMLAALVMLLSAERVFDTLPPHQRLRALLKESRKYQIEVSTELAEQVLEALWELLRGFQAANTATKGVLLGDVLREERDAVYGGLLTTLMRLVFLLFAEHNGLLPRTPLFVSHYSVTGLFERLRDDEAQYPDTIDLRYGAWAQLLTLFRLLHDGGRHGGLHLPSRHGQLFNPDAFPFLEGRPYQTARVIGDVIDPPRISDGVVFRVLRNLLVLEGERLSYRTLDVEQIGSVYEAMMGFSLGVAIAPSVALRPKHVVINLEELLEQEPEERAAWIKERAELKVDKDAGLRSAQTTEQLHAALSSRISRYTPSLLNLGSLFLQPTDERRRSGSQYTPRSLTEPIVATTFRPIFEAMGDRPAPEQILALKVCDPAMGSGAFLVAACRFLAEKLVTAWEVNGLTPKDIPPDEDLVLYARRLVAQQCLYGVDKNPFAVNLAKLSLWLATLARDHPFTFLDHALRHGDSLVGLSRERIACLHWNPKQLPLIRGFLDARVADAQRLRELIQGMGSSDNVPEKARLLRDAEDAIAEVRLIGDVIVSAFFERDKPKAREALRVAYAGKIGSWLDAVDNPWSPRPGRAAPIAPRVGGSDAGFTSPKPALPGDVGDGPNAHDLDAEFRAISEALRGGPHATPVFHWEIEFPEVFTRTNGGFDAFVGNPPFAGKNTISAANRDSYLPWLLQVHELSHGNADLVAHFYRRAFNLLRSDGAFGLIATNTIAQGDTRGTGLRWIRNHGGTIFAARKRIRWPGDAAVVVSVVHVAKGAVSGPCDLDGRLVDRISAFLFHSGGDADPFVLNANLNFAFKGVSPNGLGFVFSDTEGGSIPLIVLARLLQNPENSKVIRPYIGGEETLSSPGVQPERWIVDLDGMSVEEASRWPDVLRELENRVKPEREAKGGRIAALAWWHYERSRPEMRLALKSLPCALTTPHTAGHLCFVQQPTDRVFSQTLIVLAIQDPIAFPVLQSRIHELWARFFASSLKEDPRYPPSDCFENFPFPFGSPDGLAGRGYRSALAVSTGDVLRDPLERAGREYYEFRAELMVRHNEGLTKTYSRFHDPDERDPDILRLRDLHDTMDRAVLDAYGWADIRPACQFILDYDDEDDDIPGKPSNRRKPWRYRWPDDARDEVLGRLLELNAQRATEERLPRLRTAGEKPPPRRGNKTKPGKGTTPLPGM